MLLICKHCAKPFEAERASGRFCSGACRVAAHRKSHASLPSVIWSGPAVQLSKVSRSVNGSQALPNAELGEALLQIAEEADDGQPKTGRRFYYLALLHGYIQPDMGDTLEAKKSRDAAYKRVLKVLGTLRMAGHLAWGAVLDLTRELEKPLIYASPHDARCRMWQIYDEDRWLDQPYFPMLIVEKDTMVPACQPMADDWHMPFASSRGYSSLTLQHDVAEMLRRRHARTGQSAVVYFVSDHDPSGFDLQRAWEKALRNFAVVEGEVVRIALNRRQVHGDLERLAIAVKPSDSRSERYVEEHGERCWEADILPPETIRQAILAHIMTWLDQALWVQRDAEIERNRELL